MAYHMALVACRMILYNRVVNIFILIISFEEY